MQINLPDPNDLKNVESKDLPETSGVYFIFNNNKELIYVGESTNIKKRMLKHWSATAWYRREAKSLSFAYIIETELEMSRQRAEIIYKTYFNPKNNHTKWGAGKQQSEIFLQEEILERNRKPQLAFQEVEIS